MTCHICKWTCHIKWIVFCWLKLLGYMFFLVFHCHSLRIPLRSPFNKTTVEVLYDDNLIKHSEAVNHMKQAFEISIYFLKSKYVVISHFSVFHFENILSYFYHWNNLENIGFWNVFWNIPWMLLCRLLLCQCPSICTLRTYINSNQE